jgi:hypothetical protein
VCYIAGFLISVLSSLLFATGNIAGFAVIYTIGNLVSLSATGFLIGFVTQFKKMFDSVRIASTLIFLVAMGCTLGFALGLRNIPLTIISCIIQYCALLWYSISYIPFAQDAVKSCFRSCTGM